MLTKRISLPVGLAAGIAAAIALLLGGRRDGDASPPRLPAASVSGRSAALDTATFAGGCFWSVERFFDKVDGVVSTTSGFMGGHTASPTYEQVSAGGTGHAESVQVVYDPAKVSYAGLVNVFWHNIDPLTRDAQFCDHGTEYRSAIFYRNEAQRKEAEASKVALERSGRFTRPIVTQIVAATPFYAAEEYHQDFHRKNPARYNAYRLACGRDRQLQAIWGKSGGHAETRGGTR
jgi:peptide-methionine (S)-S-oxide reductase